MEKELEHKGRRYEQIPKMEVARIEAEEPGLVERMRADWVARGRPYAEIVANPDFDPSKPTAYESLTYEQKRALAQTDPARFNQLIGAHRMARGL